MTFAFEDDCLGLRDDARRQRRRQSKVEQVWREDHAMRGARPALVAEKEQLNQALELDVQSFEP